MMGMFKQIDKKQTVAKTEIEKIPKARPVKKVTKRASLIKMECSTASKSETSVTSVVGPMDKHVQRLPTQKPSVEDLAQLKKSSLIKMQGLTASKSETDVVGPMDKYVQPLPTEKPSIEDLAQLTVCEPVEDVLPLEHFKQQTSTLLDSVIVVPHDTRNESDFDLEDPKPTISTTDTLFDGGLLSILERKTKASKIDFTPPPVKKKEQFENPVIKKFLNLNVVKIGEMLTKKKYFLKPEVKIILPLMCKSDQEMTFKDDLWLYFIFVTDETATDVKMMVDPPLIDEFLGFSLSYALAVNSRGSLAQKEFCHKRAASFSGIFKTRLDLILHVEFSPDQDSVPVVKKVGYLAAALD
uniref:Uncharacterized protein n=1 Tax=Panagrolaimus sp. JU765 TaxID=591449 RepID=A0AC34REN4_9BILA